jgi:hypothetical protein
VRGFFGGPVEFGRRAPERAGWIAIFRDFAQQICKEPLGPAVKRGDEDWLILLKWIYFATIAAEELGVTNTEYSEQGKTPKKRLCDSHTSAATIPAPAPAARNLKSVMAARGRRV